MFNPDFILILFPILFPILSWFLILVKIPILNSLFRWFYSRFHSAGKNNAVCLVRPVHTLEPSNPEAQSLETVDQGARSREKVSGKVAMAVR